MWSCVGGRHGEKRREAWLWTAVSLGADGRRQVDFELGDRGEATFLRLYGRLPEAETYCSDAYVVYQSWLPPARHRAGRGGPVNWNEGLHSRLRGEAEPADTADERVQQERGDAGGFGGLGLPAARPDAIATVANNTQAFG